MRTRGYADACLRSRTENLLKEMAWEKDLRFDFLVAPPINRGLFEAYEHALEVLDSIEANKKNRGGGGHSGVCGGGGGDGEGV